MDSAERTPTVDGSIVTSNHWKKWKDSDASWMMFPYIIVLAARLQWLPPAQGDAVGGTWSEYDRKLKVLVRKKPVLVVPYKFNHTLELFKNYPS